MSCDKKAIKVLDPEARRIGAYATVWGELDCEGDRMTKGAIEPYVDKGVPLMFWLHGLSKAFDSALVGAWVPATFKIDETGLWVEGILGRDRVGDLAWSLIEKAGAFGLSVGSLWYLVKKKIRGDGSKDIIDWPLLEISIMEGGQQCAPSAQEGLKSSALHLQEVALKMGVQIKGARLRALLDPAIERLMESRDWTRAQVVEAMGEAAGIDSGTVNQILTEGSGGINRPPPGRLRGFARILPGVTFAQLNDAAAADADESGDGDDGSDDEAARYDRFKFQEEVMARRKSSDVVTSSDVQASVRAALAAERAEREAQELREAERQAAIEARATELALAEAKEHEEAIKKMEADHAVALKAAEDAARPTGPVAGGGTMDQLAEPNFLVVYSPYDRLSTFDLSLRYELMRSWRRRPSVKMWRALATRVAKMAREQDTLYIKNGRPYKVPAVDMDVIKPRQLLELSEIEGSLDIKSDQFHGGGFDGPSDVVTPTGLKQFCEIAVKADELIFSTQSGFGDEWVPTLMTADLWRTIRLETVVLPLFEQFDMPSQPYEYPTESTDPTFYKVAEAEDEAQMILTGGVFTDSKIGTAKVTYSAGKLGALTYWSEEMEEDAIIATEPQVRDQYGLAFAHNIDEVLISGDETTGSSNISFDGAGIDAASRYLIIDGLRHQPLVTTTADGRDGGTITIEDFGSTQGLMGTGGKFGINPRDLAFLLDTGVWHKAKLLSEVLTLDHFGPAATILTGMLGSLFGAPLLVSEDYGLTDSAGKISNSAGNNTLGSLMCINKRGIKVGWRRRPRVRVVGLPGADARYIVGSARYDIQFKEAGMVGLSYNLTI